MQNDRPAAAWIAASASTARSAPGAAGRSSDGAAPGPAIHCNIVRSIDSMWIGFVMCAFMPLASARYSRVARLVSVLTRLRTLQLLLLPTI